MKSLRTSLILYFLLLIILPLSLVVAMFTFTFYEETGKFVHQQTANILVQTEKNISALISKAKRLTEYNNDILKKGTLPLPENKIEIWEDPTMHPLRELLKTSAFNAEGIQNVGISTTRDPFFMMSYWDKDSNLVVKETQTGKDGKRYSRYWKEKRNSTVSKTPPTSWKEDDYKVETRPWYKLALEQKGIPDYEIAWTPPYIFKESGEVGITASKAVNPPGQGQRKPFAVVFTDLSLAGINVILKKLDLGRGRVFLVDSKGNLIASSSEIVPLSKSGKNLLPHVSDLSPPFFDRKIWENFFLSNGDVKINQFKKASFPLSDLMNYEYNGDVYLARTLQLVEENMKPFGWQLWIVIPQKDLLQEFKTSIRHSYILALITAMVALCISLFLWHRITGNLCKLVVAFQEVEKGNFKTHVEFGKSYREISDLGEGFNEMVHSLREKNHMEKLLSKGARENIRENVAQKMDTVVIKRGRKKSLTIFFSDIRGFTSYSEKKAPEEVISLLNQYLTIQTQLIEAYRGDIDKFIGDCVMALFEGEDGPQRALQAAQEILAEIEKLAENNENSLRVGMGIHWGNVVAGYMGSEGRADYTVIGDAVNFTSRLCSKAGPGEIWISEEIKKSLGDKIQTRTLPNMEFKGKAEPITVYIIESPKPSEDL